ncbi:MAG: TRAP transporter substrate-binding protein DctP [Gammaproteobacteria bacterium]
MRSGASAVALPFGELYTSLQTGVVDGQENPLDTIQRMKFYEVQKYLVLSDHGAMEDVVLFNPLWWNSLPEQHRQVIVTAFAEVVPALRSHKAAAVKSALSVIAEAAWISAKLQRTNARRCVSACIRRRVRPILSVPAVKASA